jgi:hypothetical protein
MAKTNATDPAPKVTVLAEIEIPQSTREGREFYATRAALDEVKTTLMGAGPGDLTVTITRA